jgi:predicted GTPase
MENFNIYKAEKSKLLQKLEATKRNILQLEDLGFDCSEAIKKLETTIKALNNDIISIALVGAFSDGKTSTIAGWLNEEMESMNISAAESTNELEIYTPNNLPEKCQIVDTPGLFGKKYSDITKKYIDEANIILYVVDAKNPIKESHQETVRWIMHDLRKIDTTIFVINKMDVVADVTDDDDFNNAARIKTETLRNKIAEIAEFSQTEAKKIQIVCISSNPAEGKDFDFWRSRRDVYLKRSHINDLENSVANVIANTSAASLVAKTGYDTLKRVFGENIKMIDLQIDMIQQDVIPTLEETLRRQKKDLENTKQQILKERPGYLRKLQSYGKKLETDIFGTSRDNIKEFIAVEIGLDNDNISGIKLQNEIDTISLEHFNEVGEKISELYKNIDKEEKKKIEQIEYTENKFIGKFSTGMKSVGKVPISTLKDVIFKGRDILNGVFGTAIKFKPWGVTKLASGLSKGLPAIGALLDLIFELIKIFQEKKANEKFKELQDTLYKIVSETISTIIDKAKDDKTFFEMFAPQILEIERKLKQDEETLAHQKEQRRRFEEWKKSATDIDFEEV